MTRSFDILFMVGAACLPGMASAQVSTGGAPGATPSDKTSEINSDAVPQEIIVTARKRSERLLDVPQSVAVVTSADLAKLDATQFRDYANTIPGLQFTTSGAGFNQITIRGITTGVSGSQTVGIYVDDVPYGASTAWANAGSLGLDPGLFDLDHIEVLRGPQGTIYGASTLGGVLKYVTVMPDTLAVGGTARAGLSSTNSGGIGYNGAAAVNLPILSDKAAVRVGAYYSHDGGFIDDIGLGRSNVDRSNVYGGRVDLLVRPTDRLSIRLVGTGQNIDRDGTAAADYDFDGSPRFGDLEQDRIVAEPFDQHFRLASGTINYQFESASLTSISSYQSVKTAFTLDFSGLYVPLLGSLGLPIGSIGVTNDTNTRKFVQEVRLQSTNRSFFEWQVGAFYTHETNKLHQFITATNPDGTPSPLPLLDAQLPSTYEEIAGFGNVTFHLTNKLQVTGGIRYAHNDQTFQQIASSILVQTLPKGKSDENVATYLVNAKYELNPDANVYVRYATGYRPGGPNGVPINPTTGEPLAPPTFDSDTLANFEAGIKARTADHRLAIDLDGYFVDWDNMQLVTLRNGIGVVANAMSGAHIYGGDLTITARPSRAFTASAAFGYTDAHLAGDDVDLGGRKGEQLPNVPKLTAALIADYVIPNTSFKPRFGGTIRYVSARDSSFDASPNAPQYHLDHYASVDLRAGATFGPVDAQVFARNLFDVRGQLSANTSLTLLGAPAQVSLLQPRTIGASLSTRF